MKKIFVLIFIFLLLLTSTVFAQDYIFPQNHMTYYLILYNSGTNTYVMYTSNSALYIDYTKVPNNYNRTIQTSGTLYVSHYSNNSWSDLSQSTYPHVNEGSPYGTNTPVKSNHDIYDVVDDTVFFSKIHILTQEMEKIPGVAIQEMVGLIGPIGILMVGSTGLLKGWSLLKTHLSGA